MKKVFNNVVSVVTAAVATFGLIGCGGGNGNSGNGGTSVEEGKSQLYVCYFDAGFSNRWLTAAAKRFEEAYKDYSFEEGKVGVQIIPDPATSGAFDQVIQTKRSEVYFVEGYSHEKYSGLTEDLTQAVSVSLGSSYGTDKNGKELPGYSGETQSIFEKMRDYEKEAYVTTNADGSLQKATVIPYADCPTGTLTYDADVFEKYALYYKADNTIGATKASGVALGLGPDGVAGTADDGLPRTYDEFFAICKLMKTRYDTTPFIWAGNYMGYLVEMATSLYVQNIGVDRVNDLLDGHGKIDDYIVGSVDTSYTTREETFDENSYNKIFNSEGLYGAVDFCYRIVKNIYFSEENCFNSNYSHEVAQADFIFGKENGDCDYGFLIDGSWWYNEAEKYVKLYEERVADRSTRNMCYMAMPKANESVWERTKGENVVYSNRNFGIVVKKGLDEDKKLLAETFLRFYCTNESLAEYNTIVSVPRGLTYTLTDEQYEALSPYGKGLYSIHAGTNDYRTYKTIGGFKNTTFYSANSAIFQHFFNSEYGGTTYSNPVSSFYGGISKGLNEKNYFNGILTARKFSA